MIYPQADYLPFYLPTCPLLLPQRQQPPAQSKKKEITQVLTDDDEQDMGEEAEGEGSRRSNLLPNGILATASADNTIKLWAIGAQTQVQATYLRTYLPTYPPTYLPTCLHIYLYTYLPH